MGIQVSLPKISFPLRKLSRILFFAFITCSYAFTAHADITSNLSGYWKCDEGTGTEVADSSGNGGTASFSGDMGWATGKIGNFACDFGGTDGYMSITDDGSELDLTGDFSVAYWHYMDTIDDVDNTLGKGGGVQLGFTTGPQYFVCEAGVSCPFFGAGTVTTGSWHHVVYTRSSNTWELYVDGSSVHSVSDALTIDANAIATVIGGQGGPPPTFRYLDGRLDDYRIYNGRALSPSDVTELYQYTTQSVVLTRPPYAYHLTSGLAGHWTFDGKDMVGGVARDRSGNGNNGNLINIATSTFYDAGKVGQAARFDGNNDYVDITETANLPIYSSTNPYSVALWFKAPSVSGQCVYSETGTAFFTNFGLCDDALGSLFVFIRNNDVVTTHPSTLLSGAFDNNWHHVVWTDQGGAGKMYLDGRLDSGNWTYTPSGTYSIVNSYIGTNSNPNGLSNTVNGYVDDVRTYKRVLSATEVQQLYNFGNTKSGVTSRTAATSGLVGHWTFDGKDMVGGVARDRSGNNNHLNLVNIATSTFYGVGKIGQGAQINGGTDYMYTLSTASLSQFTDFTMGGWAKLDTYGTPYAYILDKHSAEYNMYLYAPDQNSSVLNCAIDGTVMGKSISSLRLGEWYHFACTRTGSTVTFYLNGASLGTDTEGDPTPNSGNPLYFGNLQGSQNYVLDGTMDDIRIYNRALSATEMKQLYLMGK